MVANCPFGIVLRIGTTGNRQPTPMRFPALWTLVVAIAVAVNLGGYPLFDADEGRNAEVAREMAETNDYVLPRLNGLPYLDKPVVYFAAEAAVMEVLGPTEVAARLPAYLFTLLTALAIGLGVVRATRDATAAWTAAAVYLSMPLVLAFARTVIFDSALTFFVVFAIGAFYFAIEERSKRWTAAAWLAIGLGVLTKGPVAIALPLLVAIPWALWRKRFAMLWSVAGVIAFAAVIAPWVWAVQQHIPNFLQYVLVTETAARLATPELKRTAPFWFFVPYIIGGALPWSIVAVASFRRRSPDEERGRVIFLALWIVIPFLFFSVSQSKLPQYILPTMAPIAIVVALGWRERIASTRVAGAVAAVVGAAVLVAPLFLHRTKMRPELAAVADESAIALGGVWVAGGVLALLFARNRAVALAALTLPVIALPLVTNPIMNAIGERRSARAFVERLAPHVPRGAEIVGGEAFTGSMAFYLRRPVMLASDDGSELTSNYILRFHERFQSNPASTLKPEEFFVEALAAPQRRVFIVRNNDRERRAMLESRGLRLVATGAHHVAYVRR